MRTFLIAIMFLTGCVSHSFHSKTVTDGGMTETAAHVGPYVSYSDSTTTAESDYRVCLKQYAGWSEAVAFCNEQMSASRPDQLPLCGRGYSWYEIPGRTCRLAEIFVRNP